MINNSRPCSWLLSMSNASLLVRKYLLSALFPNKTPGETKADSATGGQANRNQPVVEDNITFDIQYSIFFH